MEWEIDAFLTGERRIVQADLSKRAGPTSSTDLCVRTASDDHTTPHCVY